MAAQKSELREVKRDGGKHFSISVVHRAALMRLVDELREVFPEKKINASTTLEYMIEKICGKHDPELKAYMQLRTEMMKLGKK